MTEFEIMQVIPFIWLSAGIIIAATEFFLPTQVSMWSGLSAIFVSILLWLGLIEPDSYSWQFFWFFILSIVLLFAWFFYFKKKYHLSRFTNDEFRDSSLANIKGKVIKSISPGIPGEVELFSPYHSLKIWKAEFLKKMTLFMSLILQV